MKKNKTLSQKKIYEMYYLEDFKTSLLNFNFVVTYIIHKILVGLTILSKFLHRVLGTTFEFS